MGILKIENVSRQFGELRAVNDVSFTVRQHEILSVIGPNGAGKSTLLNLVSHIDQPTSGRILYNENVDIATLKTHQLISLGIARTFQNIRLFEINQMNVLDNILTGMHHLHNDGFFACFFKLPRAVRNERSMREKALEAAESVGITHLLYQPVKSLSFGDRRLVELCRALVSDPKIIIMDEPAAGLNDAETEQFAALLKKLNQSGIGILLVEHHMGLVMDVSDRIIVINYGQKIAEGSPDEIKSDPKVKEAYLGGE